MSRIWFASELETVATWWRLLRRDGVTLGFTTHDGDLWFDGVLHRAAPGMMPSSIRRTAGLEADSAEVRGAITHCAIAAEDLAAGRYDGAAVVIGLVDWQSLERRAIYSGTIGAVTQEAASFTAQLQSRKADLAVDRVPRTSPACRADFCGPGCTLSPARFTHEAVLAVHDLWANAVTLTCAASNDALVGGTLRWLDGPYGGMAMRILGEAGGALVLDVPLDVTLMAGTRALVREGCNHTLVTCAGRFANAVNFQGEPFLPGNDLITRYGLTQ